MTLLSLKHPELNQYAIIFAVLALLALSANSLLLSHVLKLHQQTLIEQQNRQNSLQVTRDIEEETEALSRMVRAFTTSADTRYLTYYYDIIAIREGSKAQPDHYSPANYWSEVMAGKRLHSMPANRQGRSLLERMHAQGFSREEFVAVDAILTCADRLYKQDQIAFAATQGLYDPISKQFVDDAEPQLQFANQFVYSPHYLQLENALVQKVETFSHLTAERTNAAVRGISSRLSRSIYATIIILAGTVVGVLLAMGFIHTMVLTPMRELTTAALGFGTGDYSIRTDTKQGVGELQALGRTFNAMARNIEEDILQRERVQKELEIATSKAEESTRAKSLFLANMSHEIRTPMHAIIGMAYLALNRSLDQQQRDYIDTIDRAAQSLLAIINDILDFSKIEANKMQLEIVAFRIEDVASNVLTLLRQQASAKGLSLLLDIKHSTLLGPTGTFLGDPVRLEQILTNLLSNAVKFSDKGHVKLTIEESGRKGDSCELKFSIEDTGIGLTPEQQGQIFQEFTQADSSTTRRYGGTGLGLSITKRLINLMEGQLSVRSELHQGTQFTCTITLPQPQTIRSQTVPPPFSGQAIKALIVDDHQSAPMVLRTMLDHFGVASTVVDSGEAALQLLAQPDAAVDILFIDWLMPGIDGEQLITALKALPTASPPLIAVVSADNQDRIHELYAQHIIYQFLPKPVLPQDLRKLLLQVGSSPPADTANQPVADKTRLKGMRVLVTEDSTCNQLIAKEMLTDHGVAVEIANNGQEAVDKIRSLPDDYYHAVLMDIQMPVMDGYEATRILRGQPRYASLPIIAMTAHAMLEEQQRGQAVGMNAHITKPFDLELLLHTLSTYYTGSAPPLPSPHPPKTGTSPKNSLRNDCLPRNIAGVDTALGLSLCANNTALYRKVLQGYARRYENLASTLHTLRQEEQWDDLFLQAHTFKGLSATIGAQSLQDLAARLEEGCGHCSPTLHLLIKELDEQLPATIDAVHRFFAKEEKKTTNPSGSLRLSRRIAQTGIPLSHG
jgi:two-component system sensor histidine kinase/response regulator